ncbi:hypothetical protein Ahy_A01g003641 isoform B [Arachis hypogaea]|uniref:Uncharacterized protein n=1 Tax=Arachis hypogaea TaxID=3818 RepID=A0A445ETV4_ARAHY|nr:hypothetical protein Ahy_A01g003641 isoform B [Arachis hypogaea]
MLIPKLFNWIRNRTGFNRLGLAQCESVYAKIIPGPVRLTPISTTPRPSSSFVLLCAGPSTGVSSLDPSLFSLPAAQPPLPAHCRLRCTLATSVIFAAGFSAQSPPPATLHLFPQADVSLIAGRGLG